MRSIGMHDTVYYVPTNNINIITIHKMTTNDIKLYNLITIKIEVEGCDFIR